MSSAALKHALDLALELPADERAALVHDLLASLDGPADADTAEAWDAEIARRSTNSSPDRRRPSVADESLRRIDERLRR